MKTKRKIRAWCVDRFVVAPCSESRQKDCGIEDDPDCTVGQCENRVLAEKKPKCWEEKPTRRKPTKPLDWNAFGDTEEKLRAIEEHRKRSEKSRLVVRAEKPTTKARKP